MRRSPRFYSYDEVLADAESLLSGGYERAGAWSLGQVCEHLSRAIGKSMDGYPSLLPLPLRMLLRWIALGAILKHRQSSRQSPTPAYLVPPVGEDDRAGLEKLRVELARLKGHSGEFKTHPAFGRLTPPQWLEFHLWHCEHHLSFLTPRKESQPA